MRPLRFLPLLSALLMAGCGDPDPATAPVAPRIYAPPLPKVNIKSVSDRLLPKGFEVQEFRAVNRINWAYKKNLSRDVILSATFDGSDPSSIEDVMARCLFFDKGNHDAAAIDFFIDVLGQAYQGSKRREMASWLRENFNKPDATICIEGVEFCVQYAPMFRQLRIRIDPYRPAREPERFDSPSRAIMRLPVYQKP